ITTTTALGVNIIAGGLRVDRSFDDAALSVFAHDNQDFNGSLPDVDRHRTAIECIRNFDDALSCDGAVFSARAGHGLHYFCHRDADPSTANPVGDRALRSNQFALLWFISRQ